MIIAVFDCFRTSICHFEKATATAKSILPDNLDFSQEFTLSVVERVRNDRILIHSLTTIINITVWRRFMAKTEDKKKETKKKPLKTPKDKK